MNIQSESQSLPAQDDVDEELKVLREVTSLYMALSVARDTGIPAKEIPGLLPQ